jgi:hypothetical protein
VSLTAPRLDLDAALIWSSMSADGACVAGVSVEEDPEPLGSWRHFVDLVH